MTASADFSINGFDASKSTKGASKLRRDLINAEIANLRDLLPLPPSTRQRLSQLQLMALVCVYVRKTNYFQQAFKCHSSNLQSTTPSIGFSKALNGFLMMMTQNGKLLYISDNAAEYLGHSMEDLLIHGDSVYDIIDKQDHPIIQAEMARSAGSEDEARMFMCRINVSRNARRQMRFGDQKVVLVQGHYLSFLPLCSRNEPVFIATCTPIAMPETRECVVQGATNVFTSIHSMDMKFMYLDRIGEYHLGFLWAELQGVSWYKLLHWECMQEAQAKHRLITQSDQDRACILLVRLQRRLGDWIWVHCVLQVKDSVENNQHPVIVCTNQILSDREAVVMRSNNWLYEYYMVQSKLQYGITYAGGQGAVSRVSSYYHQHSPQTQNSQPMHHVYTAEPVQATSPRSVLPVPSNPPSSLVAVSEHTNPSDIRVPSALRHSIEKLEPVDYSLHQSPSYHVYPPSGRCFSSSSTGEDSLDTFSRPMDDNYIHQYRSIVTVTQYNPSNYSSASPDTYSYQVLGSEPQAHHLGEYQNYSYTPHKYAEVEDEQKRGQTMTRYRNKMKKSSTGSISSTITLAQSERESYQEDDEVFMNQWKPQTNSQQHQISPVSMDHFQTNKQTIDLNEKEKLENRNQEVDEPHDVINNKRKVLLPLSIADVKETKSPRLESLNSGSITELGDSGLVHHPNICTYESVRPNIIYANKDTLYYWKHFDNYREVHLDLESDQYVAMALDSATSLNLRNDFNQVACDEHTQQSHSPWHFERKICPLHPPLPATLEISSPLKSTCLAPSVEANYCLSHELYGSNLLDEMIY